MEGILTINSLFSLFHVYIFHVKKFHFGSIATLSSNVCPYFNYDESQRDQFQKEYSRTVKKTITILN